jgi:type IV pilus assembly protein PilN
MTRIQVNLASEPFRRDRLLLAGSGLVAVLMLAMLGLLITLTLNERGEVKSTRDAIGRYQAQLAQLNAEQAKVDAVLRQPRNAEVLERSLFLNTLLARKGISWTKIFSDLESVLPHNVRIIQVRLSPQNETLDMVVGAQASEPVLDLLMRLERSPLFGPAEVHSWLPPSQTEPLYRYRVSVKYVQTI